MKKLFGSLMALSIFTSAASVVVSCARGPRMQQITTKFSQLKIGDADYKQNEMWEAFNGTPVTFYGNVAPLKQLSRNILNLLGFNQSLVTQPKRIKEMRQFYIGEDSVEEGTNDILFTPSVDGTFYGENVIGKSQTDFYNLYAKTQINSIAGLYQLYQFGENNPGVISAPGASQSLNVIKDSFNNNAEATQSFINSFLLDSNNYDSAWMSQTYDFGEGFDMSSLKLDSKVTPFDFKSETKDSKKINELIFEGGKDLGQPTSFTKLNTEVDPIVGGKIGNNKSEPFDLLLLPPVNPSDIPDASANALFDLTWKYDKDEIDGLKKWDVRKASDPSGWKFKATNEVISEKDATTVTKGYVKTNDSIVVPLKPLKMKYEYSTNARDQDAQKFLVNLEIDGVQAIFNPVGYLTRFKDEKEDSKLHGNRYIKWQFSHYQFNDINNVYSPFGHQQANKVGHGYYSGFKINSMKVEKI